MHSLTCSFISALWSLSNIITTICITWKYDKNRLQVSWTSALNYMYINRRPTSLYPPRAQRLIPSPVTYIRVSAILVIFYCIKMCVLFSINSNNHPLLYNTLVWNAMIPFPRRRPGTWLCRRARGRRGGSVAGRVSSAPPGQTGLAADRTTDLYPVYSACSSSGAGSTETPCSINKNIL